MRIQFGKVLGAIAVVAACTGMPGVAIANPESNGIYVPGYERSIGLDEAFDRAFFKNDRETFINQTIPRQLDFLFGLRNSFTDNEIRRDAKEVHELYREAYEDQVSSDPILRTQDLPNPYNTSVNQIQFGQRFR
jgi:hypothetical protein